jgi:hypothetical protein
MARKQPTGESPKDYAEMAARPLAWQWVSRDLLAAANALHLHRRGPGPRERKGEGDSRIDMSPAPILLLYGMALENLLKGLVIAKGMPATVKGQLNPKLKTHDVLKLWGMAGLTVDENAEPLLSALGWAVQTGGRYPVGLQPSPSSMRHLSVAGTSVECFVALFEAAEEALRGCVSDALFEKTILLNWGV